MADLTYKTIPGLDLLASIDGTEEIEVHQDGAAESERTSLKDYIESLIPSVSAVPIGVMADYVGTTAPDTDWSLTDYDSISQATYSALFALIGHKYAKTKADRDTAEIASEFHIPDNSDNYIRGGFSKSFDAADITTGTERITITAHGITRDGTPVRFFTSGTLPAVITALTDQSWETLYIRVIDANTIELYDTEANAIDTSGTTGIINFADQGIGSHELTQQGINVDDAFQGYDRNLGSSDGTDGVFVHNLAIGASKNGARLTSSTGTSNQIITKDYIDDGTNGTPRVINETRGRTSFAFKIIKIL